jgi:hypothetical protein
MYRKNICHEEKNRNFIVCVFAHVNYRNKIIKVTVGVLKGIFGISNENRLRRLRLMYGTWYLKIGMREKDDDYDDGKASEERHESSKQKRRVRRTTINFYF